MNKDRWIEELKKDFPEYLKQIDAIDGSIEYFTELAEQYYFCKYQAIFLRSEGKDDLYRSYTETLHELQEELRSLLTNQAFTLKKNK